MTRARILLILAIFTTDPALAESRAVGEFARSEAEGNSIGGFSFPFQRLFIPHLQIELSDARRAGAMIDLAIYLPEAAQRMLIFKEGNREFLRFFYSPEDESYHRQLKEYLNSKGIAFSDHLEFPGFRTASRSLIVVDPRSDYAISYKPSTSKTFNDTRDRRLSPGQAYLGRRLSDYYRSQADKLRYLKIAYEGAAVAFPELGFASSIRLMDEMSAGEVIHVSGFTVENAKYFKSIPERCGMGGDSFWREAHVILGKSLAELAAVLGFHHTSAHAQNFRWELDAHGCLTGHVVLVDLTDGSPQREIFERNGQTELLKQWQSLSQSGIEQGGFGISIFTPSQNPQHRASLAEGFRERLFELTSLSISEINRMALLLETGTTGEVGRQFPIVDFAKFLHPRAAGESLPAFHSYCENLVQNKSPTRLRPWWKIF